MWREKGIKENNNEEIIKNARGYAELIKDHISKEDGILYPMADQVLSLDTKNNLFLRFKQIENEWAEEKEGYISFIEGLNF